MEPSTYLEAIPKDILWFLLRETDPIHLISLRNNSPELAGIWAQPKFLPEYQQRWISLLEEVKASNPTGELKIRNLTGLAVFGQYSQLESRFIFRQMLRLALACQDYITSQLILPGAHLYSIQEFVKLLSTSAGWSDVELNRLIQVAKYSEDHLADIYMLALNQPEIFARLERVLPSVPNNQFLKKLVRVATVEQYQRYEHWDIGGDYPRGHILRSAVLGINLPVVEYLLSRFHGDYSVEDLNELSEYCDLSIVRPLFRHGANNVFECLIRAVKYQDEELIDFLRTWHTGFLAQVNQSSTAKK